MIASLYQRGSRSCWSAAFCTERSDVCVAIDSLIRGPRLRHPEDMSGHDVRIQLYVVPCAAPRIARVAQKIMYLVRLVFAETQRLQIHLDPRVVRMLHVHVDDREDHVVFTAARCSNGLRFTERITVRIQ